MSTTPQRLGKYELQKLLGKGSTGEVWHDYDQQIQQDVAIKLLHLDLLQNDPNFMAFFMKEWQLITSLHHPNIVQVHEANISRPPAASDTTPYIVMDYIEGQTTLANINQRTSRIGNFLPISDIVYLFNALGSAIDYAHQQGIAHGNIKPTNILFDTRNMEHMTSGEPLLTDFGIANLPGNKSSISPYYLSPEQVRGDGVHPSSDIYALGVLLYEICTGVLPFHAESPVSTMLHHINSLPTPPMLINPHIPPTLSEVILRAMAKDVNTRFATASLLATAIAEAWSVDQAPHLALNKTRSLSRNFQFYPASGSLRQPLTHSQPIPDMTSILGVSQPLPQLSSSQLALRGQETLGAQSTAKIAFSRNSEPLPSAPSSPLLPVSNSKFPLSQLQTQTSGRIQTPIPSLKQPTPPPTPLARTGDMPTFRSNNVISPAIMFIVLLLLLVVVGSLGVSLLLHSTSKQTTATTATSVVGHVFFQDDALGQNDLLRIEMQNIPSPPQGKRYYAWLQNIAGPMIPLGPLSTQNGTTTLLYMGDTHHTNLLSTVQAIFVTLEKDQSSTPLAPSTNAKVYQASFAAASFPYIQHILYQQPGFSTNSSLINGLLVTIMSINEKAGSIVDSLQGTPDDALVLRQATRIIELIDGSRYARSSADLPRSLPHMLSVPVGLISAPGHAGYLDTLSEQVNNVIQTAGDNTELRQHAQNVSNAIIDLRNWIQKMRNFDIQILKAPDLSTPAIMSTALQMQQLAEDTYTGRTIPPNPGPLPISGSAGAYQAFVECQYMATLDIKKVA